MQTLPLTCMATIRASSSVGNERSLVYLLFYSLSYSSARKTWARLSCRYVWKWEAVILYRSKILGDNFACLSKIQGGAVLLLLVWFVLLAVGRYLHKKITATPWSLQQVQSHSIWHHSNSTTVIGIIVFFAMGDALLLQRTILIHLPCQAACKFQYRVCNYS